MHKYKEIKSIYIFSLYIFFSIFNNFQGTLRHILRTHSKIVKEKSIFWVTQERRRRWKIFSNSAVIPVYSADEAKRNIC